jgi:hypothetical protein
MALSHFADFPAGFTDDIDNIDNLAHQTRMICVFGADSARMPAASLSGGIQVGSQISTFVTG